MRESIRVHVVRYPDRQNLMMRYVDPFTGKAKAKSTGTTNRREAERIAAKWEDDLQKGRYKGVSRVSWDDFRRRYEDEVLTGLADNTDLTATTALNVVQKHLSPQRLQDLTAQRISYFQGELRRLGRAEATIRTYLKHLRAALNWAVGVDLLDKAPKIALPKRAKDSKHMKGRPITTEEFERMLAKTEHVVGPSAAPSWRNYLEGLWWSGLRLAESMQLWWDRDDKLTVDLASKRPMFRILAEHEKGNRDRLLPLAPEFADMLLELSEDLRRGPVFRLKGLRTKTECRDPDWVGKVVSRIGRAAGVKVNTDTKTGKVKYASAHDLRRSFGERWSRRIMPQDLRELMRHETIETTMKYYVGRNAQTTADVLWDSYAGRPELGNISGNSQQKTPEPTSEHLP